MKDTSFPGLSSDPRVVAEEFAELAREIPTRVPFGDRVESGLSEVELQIVDSASKTLSALADEHDSNVNKVYRGIMTKLFYVMLHNQPLFDITKRLVEVERLVNSEEAGEKMPDDLGRNGPLIWAQDQEEQLWKFARKIIKHREGVDAKKVADAMGS